MIADEREGPIETAFKMLTAPVWVPIYFAYVGCRKLAEAWSRRKPKPVEPEILTPVQSAWMPTREFERAVFRGADPCRRAGQQPPPGGVDGLLSRRSLKGDRATRGRYPQGS